MKPEIPVWLLSAGEIARWREDYDKHEDMQTRHIEQKLRIEFQRNKHSTHSEMAELLTWKFYEMPGRLKRELNLLSKVTPDFVKRVTEEAFRETSESLRFRKLRTIKGVGAAVASVILAFYEPENYGVLDIHAWRELFGKEESNAFKESDFVRFTETLRSIGRIHGLPAREVEKAIFRKNRVQPREP